MGKNRRNGLPEFFKAQSLKLKVFMHVLAGRLLEIPAQIIHREEKQTIDKTLPCLIKF